jgi:N-glycosylase/DNA lyase
MKFVKNNQNIVVTDLRGLSLDLTLDCGQAFRWEKKDDGLWHGVALGRALTLGSRGIPCVFITRPPKT